MANYSTDFTEYTTGVIPSDWTAGWDATTQFTVGTGGADKILKGAITASNRYICTWNDVGADANRANVEILTKFRVLSVVGGGAGGVARASGTGTTETGYTAYIQDDDLRVAKYVSGTATALVTQALTLLANTDYWLRFRVNGTALQARIWLATDAEPGTWGIDTTDTSISAAGWAGVFTFSSDSDPEYDAIAIATNGDTASFATGGITGTGSPSITAVTASGTGTLAHTGAGSLTTAATTASGTGTVEAAGVVTGTGAITVGAATASGAGVLAHTGSGALSSNVVSITGAGSLAHTGTGAATTAAATVSGGGFLGTGVTGTGSITIGNVVVSGTGNRIGWDVAANASGSWTEQTPASGGWTEQAQAAGNWTNL